MANLLVTPFTIVIDNREQRPYDFASVPPRRAKEEGRERLVKTERRYLKTGDYSLDTLESSVGIERKSLEDLYGTLGRGHARFKREMERLQAMDFAAIVIEATKAQIMQPERHWIEVQSHQLKTISHIANMVRHTTTAETDAERIAEMEKALDHIKFGVDQLYNPEKKWRSQVSPRTIYGTICSWRIKFPSVQWIYAGNRRRGEMVTFHLLESFWESVQRRKDKE